MLSFYDVVAELGDADFPDNLLSELKQLRRRFIDEFERRYPGKGEGRTVWR